MTVAQTTAIGFKTKLSFKNPFLETGQRNILSQVLICCSYHWRQYLTAPPGYFSFPRGSMWSMTVNFPAPRQSSLTTLPWWFWWSSILLSTKMRNSTRPKIGSVWLIFNHCYNNCLSYRNFAKFFWLCVII